jgi:hypothetical protein
MSQMFFESGKRILFIFFLLIHLSISIAEEPGYLDLSGNWKFHTDPENRGLPESWFRLNFDDSNWDQLAVPGFWENKQSFAGYDGIAWYRFIFQIPEKLAGRNIYLGLGGVDDEFDLWIDEKHVGHFGDRPSNFTYYQRKSVHELPEPLSAGKHLITLRVVDWQGGGGIHRAPVGLSVDTSFFQTPLERLEKLVKKFPEALWPYWLQEKGRAWTVIGLEEAVAEGMVSWDGALGAKEWPFSISLWFQYEEDKIYAPERYSPQKLDWSLQEGYLPLPVLKFADSKFEIEQGYAALPDLSNNYSEGIAQIRYRVTSRLDQPVKGNLNLMVRPYLVQGRAGELTKFRWDEDAQFLQIEDRFQIWSDAGKPQFLLMLPVCCLSIPESPGDISRYLMIDGPLWPLSTPLDTLVKLNAAALAWRVTINPGKNEFRFIIPLGQSEQKKISRLTPQPMDLEELVHRWQKTLRGVEIQLPDRRVTDAYYASLAYILINADQFMPHPGPWAYDLFWYRDTAYMLAALLRNGKYNFARRTLQHLMKAQLASGEFPPIFDLNYQQVGHREWDSQGQAIFTLAEYSRFTGETGLIQQNWNQIERGVRFLDSLQSLSPAGILPPSWSAEDLGSQQWHHFWDDFWAIRGLQDASWLAKQIGEREKSAELFSKAEILRSRVRSSIDKIIKENNISWIPNGPEDLYGSSMARGTTPGIWPGGALNVKDPLVKKSFDYYWEKWIAPFNGAYLHQGNFWPYAFELATCFILLDQPDRAKKILDWHLNHQTMPGVYAWGEQIDSTSLTFYAGDIPHGWVAADYINFVQHLLCFVRQDSLILGAGIPEEWLETGQIIKVQGMPTYLGKVTYSQKLVEESSRLEWDIEVDPNRAKGICLQIPDSYKINSVRVDGKIWKKFYNRKIIIPAFSRMVTAQVIREQKRKNK